MGNESRIIPPRQNLTKKNLHFPQSLFPIGIFPMEPQLSQIKVCRMKYGSFTGKTFWKVNIPDASAENWFLLQLYSWISKDRLHQGDYFILYLKNQLKSFPPSKFHLCLKMVFFLECGLGWVGSGLDGCITLLKSFEQF